jgi:hypothetical protein
MAPHRFWFRHLTLFLAMASAFVASAFSVGASITHLVSVEVIEGRLSTLRMWTNVAVMWIEAVINVGETQPRCQNCNDWKRLDLRNMSPVCKVTTG